MTGNQWLLFSGLGVIYLVLLFTAGVLALRKGHFVLLIVGVFFPFLWLVGAMLPARPGYRAGKA